MDKAKDDKFNFNQSPAAKEVGEEMAAVNQPVEEPKKEESVTQILSKKKKKKASNKDWTLVQCRLPNNLNRRLSIYVATHTVSKNDFIEEAVRRLLKEVKA